MSTTFAVAPRRSIGWYAAPALILIVAAILANLGVKPTPSAQAASTDSVTVTATVASAVSITDCGANLALTVAIGTYSDAGCAITFGATNDTTTTARVYRPAGATFFSSIFADEGGTCANLGTVDEAGWKTASVSQGSNASSCATLEPLNENDSAAHKGLTTTATNACASSTNDLANACVVAIGVWEAAPNASGGASATGTLNFDVVG